MQNQHWFKRWVMTMRNIVWKKISLGWLKGDIFSAVQMCKLSLSSFWLLTLLVLLGLFWWLLNSISSLIFCRVGRVLLLGMSILFWENRWSTKWWFFFFFPALSLIKHLLAVAGGSLKWSQRPGLTLNQETSFQSGRSR